MLNSKITIYWRSWRDLWVHLNHGQRKKLLTLLLLMITASFLEAVSIGLVVPFLTILLNPNALIQWSFLHRILLSIHIELSWSVQAILTTLFCLTVIVAGVTRVVLAWYTSMIAFSIGSSISSKVYEKALYQPYSYHIKNSSSMILSTASTKAGNVIFNTIIPVINLINSGLMLIAIMITLILINAKAAGIIFLLLFTFYFFVTNGLRKRTIMNGYLISIEQTNVIKFLQEGLRGIKHIILNGNQNFFLEAYKQSDIRLRKSQGNNQFIAQCPKYIIETLGIFGIALVGFFYSNDDPLEMQRFIPLAGVLVLSSQRLLPSIQQAYSAFSAIRSGHLSLLDVLLILKLDESQERKTNPKPLFLKNEIEVNNLSFKYEKDSKYIFKGLNFVIKKGECVGVIGKTGAGKSTLIDLIAGLLSPSSGSISVDGELIDNSNISSWRSQIAYVPQTIFLSEGTIAENIALGIPVEEINSSRIRWAAQQAKIDSFIEDLPGGYDSKVGESGIKISGGQRQRIAIARALYKSASIIILDEATSALDIQTEEEVMSAIGNLRGRITLFIITHRTSAMKGYDKIIKLESGTAKVVKII